MPMPCSLPACSGTSSGTKLNMRFFLFCIHQALKRQRQELAKTQEDKKTKKKRKRHKKTRGRKRRERHKTQGKRGAKKKREEQKKKSPALRGEHRGHDSKTAAAYSPALHCSTIGDGGLNCSVRNGKRWNPAAIATWILR